MDKFDEIEFVKDIFDAEIKELLKVKDSIDEKFIEVADLIYNCKGKVVITGIGKSGLIGKKISATFASTGTPTIFMNSAEGLHGDLGMIGKDDVVIAISNSGNSDEVVSLIPSIKKIGAKLVGMTGNFKSRLAINSDYLINIGIEKEACPLNLAPMSSTTATLVVGDALASLLMKKRGFKPENFALYHPGGSLGKRLLMRVGDIMKKNIPISSENSTIDEVILEMTEKRLGAVCILENGIMSGIITEGDIRRALSKKEEFFNLKARDIMTKNFTKVSSDNMAVDALELMENRESQISVLPVMDGEKLVGVIRIHDLVSAVGK